MARLSLTCFAVPQRWTMRCKVQNLLYQTRIYLFAGLQLVARWATGSLPCFLSTPNSSYTNHTIWSCGWA